MKNIPKTKKRITSRSLLVDKKTFKLGYKDAYDGRPYNSLYNTMSFGEQLWYEQGRLIAVALKTKGIAPLWKDTVKCPRDLPRLIREGHAYGAIPASAERRENV